MALPKGTLHPSAPAPDLGAALFATETSGQLPTDGWPALRQVLLTLADAHAVGDGQCIASQLDAAVGPLRALLAARAALVQACVALDAGYAALARAGDDPVQLANAAVNSCYVVTPVVSKIRSSARRPQSAGRPRSGGTAPGYLIR